MDAVRQQRLKPLTEALSKVARSANILATVNSAGELAAQLNVWIAETEERIAQLHRDQERLERELCKIHARLGFSDVM